MKWFEQNNCKSRRLDFAYSMSDRLSSHNPTSVGKEETNSLHRLTQHNRVLVFLRSHSQKQHFNQSISGDEKAHEGMTHFKFLSILFRMISFRVSKSYLFCITALWTLSHHPIRTKQKPFVTRPHTVSRAFRQLQYFLILIGSFWFNLAPRVDRTLGTRLTWSYNTSLKTENFCLNFQAFYCGGYKTKCLFERRGTEKEVSR